ncbi:MAG: metallophosphoesterase family protein [Nanoarchaeota archaeon]
MKLFIFTDLHGNRHLLDHAGQNVADADAIVCAGDLTIFESKFAALLGHLGSMNRPTFIIPGNHEDPASLDCLCRKHPQLMPVHLRSTRYRNLLILGHGGGGFSHTSAEFRTVYAQFKKEAQDFRAAYPDGKILFLIHQPPYGTALDQIDDRHTGNHDYRDFILEASPDYVFCGHLHENAGVYDRLGESIILNPGPEGILLDAHQLADSKAF